MAQKKKLFLILISLVLVGFCCSVLLFMNQAIAGITKNTATLKSGLPADNTKLLLGGLLEPISFFTAAVLPVMQKVPDEIISVPKDTPEVLQGKWRLMK